MTSEPTQIDSLTGLVGGHPVLDLIARRAADKSRPTNRADGARLALVVEGGGMRGVVSGGMVTALGELGLRDVFDFVIGTSAGALAGAFFVAGEPRRGTTIYYEDLIGREWLDYRRALRRQPAVGLDYLIDDVMVGRKPLDWEAVLDSKVPLYAVATRVRDWQPVILGDFADRAELSAALRGSSRIPLIAGRPVPFRGEEYIDGSLRDAIPMESAMSLGATHMLVLLTRPTGQVRSDPGLLQRVLAFPAMNAVMRGLGDVYGERAKRYRRELDELVRLEAGPAEGPAAYGIRLARDASLVHQLEQDPEQLLAGAAVGAMAVNEALTGVATDTFRIPHPVA